MNGNNGDSRNYGKQVHDQSDMSVSNSNNKSAMNFTIDEYQSEGIGPNQLVTGMGLQHESESTLLSQTNDDNSVNDAEV